MTSPDHHSSARPWVIGLAVSAGLLVVLGLVFVGLIVAVWVSVDGESDDVALDDAGSVEQPGDGVEDADVGGADDVQGTSTERAADVEGAEDVIAVYEVDGDQIVAVDGRHTEGDRIWERFVDLIPRDEREMIVGFEVLDSPDDAGLVYPSDDDPTDWILGVSVGLGPDLDPTLIHEFGHLLTLQADEVPPGGHSRDCATYFTGEGCALDGSIFAGFVGEFWTDAMLTESARIEAKEDWDAAEVFYDQRPDEFVSDYAATNPGEDLAETFMVFVLEPAPTGDDVLHEKLRFLWEESELVELREEIRADL